MQQLQTNLCTNILGAKMQKIHSTITLSRRTILLQLPLTNMWFKHKQ